MNLGIRSDSSQPNQVSHKIVKVIQLYLVVEEHDSGTHWIQRSLSDVVLVMSVLSSIDDHINNHLVTDCRRLGKFAWNKTPHPILPSYPAVLSCRPILARLVGPLEVQSVLSKNITLLVLLS